MNFKEISQYCAWTILVIVIFLGCEKGTSPEKEREELDKRKLQIIDFANSKPCYMDSECRYIGLGSKPCGGYWEYIVYSTGIDTATFYKMVADYNADEDAYNRKWGITSDCSAPEPPHNIYCKDGRCFGF